MTRRKKPPGNPSSLSQPCESPRSVAATVAWMLATLTTFVAMLAVFGLQIAALNILKNEAVLMLSRLMLFAAAISGSVALLLLAVTWRVREVRPPLAIVVTSLVIALTPLVSVAVIFARG